MVYFATLHSLLEDKFYGKKENKEHNKGIKV